MNLACALHFSGLKLPFKKQCRLIAEAGFTAIEVSPWMQGKLTRTRIRELKASMRKNDLAFSGFTAIYPPNMILAAASASVRKRNVAYTNSLIELTSDLEGQVMVWGSGRARTIPPGTPFRNGYAWLVGLLKASGSFAYEKRVKIGIEPLSRFESGIIHNTNEALKLARAVRRKSLGTVYDTFEASLEEKSLTEPLIQAGKLLAAVHVSDCNRKIPGAGHLNFDPIFKALKTIKYDGFITLEATLSADFRRELKISREFLSQRISE